MALFGLPGGAEWWVILFIIMLLFGPTLLGFVLGFLVGRRSGRRWEALPEERSTMPEGGRAAETDKPATAQCAIPAEPAGLVEPTGQRQGPTDE